MVDFQICFGDLDFYWDFEIVVLVVVEYEAVKDWVAELMVIWEDFDWKMCF